MNDNHYSQKSRSNKSIQENSLYEHKVPLRIFASGSHENKAKKNKIITLKNTHLDQESQTLSHTHYVTPTIDP